MTGRRFGGRFQGISVRAKMLGTMALALLLAVIISGMGMISSRATRP
ncbi:hypothetical protein ACFQX7_10885 [Luedemannella flava]